MRFRLGKIFGAFLLAQAIATAGFASDILENAAHEPDVTNAVPLLFTAETSGPVRTPKAGPPGTPVSGQGFWKFAAARELVPVPPEIPSVTNAHSTLIVDKESGNAYWTLPGIGWIGFSNQLRSSWIVAGDPVFTNGNLHGADILPRPGKTPLVAVADNVAGRIYLTDITFQNAEILERPAFGAYATNNSFRPTDVAFVNEHELWVADGYAHQRFMPVDFSPLHWRGELYGGGKFSKNLHGITYDSAHDEFIFAARTEGQLKRVGRVPCRTSDIAGLPAGTLPCDVDLWGDYMLVPCLEGTNHSAGPIYIINTRKHAIVSMIKPKEDLGYTDAQHIHDAAWYVTGKGREQEIYIIFTNWRPGGIGALKLVNVAD
jgi:hypothetical protein